MHALCTTNFKRLQGRISGFSICKAYSHGLERYHAAPVRQPTMQREPGRWAWRGRAKPENLFHWSSCVRHDLSLALELRVRGKLSTARRLDPKASLTSLHLSLYPGGEVAGGSPRSNQPPAIQQLVPSCGQSITTSFGKARGGTLASRHHMNHNS